MDRSRLQVSVLCSVGALILVGGCGGEDGFLPYDDAIGRSESWIINGQLDYDHDAVVATFTQNSGCSGTIIHVDGSYAYMLTAAHCFGSGPLQWVAIGDNYDASSTEWLQVVDYQVHPSYDTNELIYDFAMVKAAGAHSGTPVIPAMTPGEDNLSNGSQVTHVGYGLTSYPNGSTSQRHYAVGTLNQVASIQIAYNQPVSGPCSGDSGGPNLSNTSGGERVAGVVSYGDQECAQMGVSGRVSAVYNSFIQPFIGVSTSSTSTSSSSSTSTSGTGGEAGTGGTTSTSSGTGGTGPVDEGWVAADLDEQKYRGELVESTCSAGQGQGSSSGAGGLLAAMVGLLGWCGRRRGRR